MAQQSSPDINQILSTIRQVESSNNYGAQAKGSSASGAYQFIDSTWQASTKKAGLGTEYARAKDAPPEVQDAVAAFAVRDILSRTGNDVTKVPLVWYTGNPEGRMTADALKANQGLTPDKYQQKWLSVLGGGASTKTAQAPRTTAQRRAPMGGMTLASLPDNYRIALATSYLGETEDPEEAVAERAVRMMEEAQGGGAAKIQKTIAQAVPDETIDPFKVMAQAQAPQKQPSRAVPRMPRTFAEGGEASLKEKDDLTQEDKDEEFKRAQSMLFNMRANAGPVTGQFVPGTRGVDVRASTQAGPVRPYVDVSPNARAVTQVGATYGNVGPQGGYEVEVSKRAPMQTPFGKLEMPVTARGSYSAPVGKMGQIQAQGYYVPRQGQMPQANYGANLRYVQRFQEGGEVDYNQMMVGTLLPPPEEPVAPMVRPGISVPTMSEVPRVDAQGRVIREAPTPDQVYTPLQRAVGGVEALGAVASGLTAPASILYDVARGVPAKEISPGRFMYEPRTEAGQEYTRGIGRLAQDLKLDAALPQVQLQRPYPVGAMARQGIAALETGTEKMTLPVFRKITGNPDATKEQMMDFVLDQRSILEQGAPSIVKPKGGTFASSPASNVEISFDIFNDAMNGRKATYSLLHGRQQGGEEMIKKLDAANDFINSKFKNYYQKKLGSQDDPLRDAFIRGDFKGLDYFPQDRGNRSREILADPDSTHESKRVALQDLNELYDMWTDIEYVSPGNKTREQVVDIIYKKLKEQGVEDLYRSDIQSGGNLLADPTVLGDRGRLAEKQGDVVYDANSGALLRGRMSDLTDYLVTLNPNQIKNLTFEDAMIRAERFHEQMNNPVNKYTREELFEGRDNWFKPNKKYQWTEIKTEEALRREGAAMGHCIKGDDYCLQLTSGVARHFSLQDAKTGEPHTTISIYRSPYNNKPDANHVIVQQIKGKSNSVASKYFSEIAAFLNEYEKTVGKIYVTEKEKHIPKPFRSEEYTKLPKGYGGNEFAKGGMVDKPLYDRVV